MLASAGLVTAAAAPSTAQSPDARWKGLYFGVHGGFLSAETGTLLTTLSMPSPSQVLEGPMGGAQLGYNWQVGGLVVGLEVDSSFGMIASAVDLDAGLKADATLTAMGSARARLGYSFGNFMPYVTGGLAWAVLEQGNTCTPTGTPSSYCDPGWGFDVRSKQLFIGWVAGGGAEFAINGNWSVKAEGLVGSFNTQDFVGAYGGKTFTSPIDLNMSYSAKVGINYRF
jgi:outer membrane immunogenic protein